MKGKICLVTGAAGGIGTAACRRMHDAGAAVAVLDVNREAGVALAGELGGLYIDCNVADGDSFGRAVSTCIEQLGVPDYAFINAGVMTVGPSEDFVPVESVTLDQLQRIVGVNVAGVFNGLKVLLPLMREKGGTITVTASTVGLSPLPIDPLYSMTKHAVIGLCRSVAAANEGSNVAINVICPGGVDTAIVPQVLLEGGMQAMSPDDIATEVMDLLLRAPNGEVRVKSSADTPAFVVDPPDVNR